MQILDGFNDELYISRLWSNSNVIWRRKALEVRPTWNRVGDTDYKHLLIPGRSLLLQLMMINDQSGTNQQCDRNVRLSFSRRFMVPKPSGTRSLHLIRFSTFDSINRSCFNTNLSYAILTVLSGRRTRCLQNKESAAFAAEHIGL